MLDESIVQIFCRIRVHATKRVESKRNEVMAVPVTDLPVRLDVVVVEQLKARQGTGLSLSPVIDTKRIGRITDGHVQNVQPPALIVYILVCSACGVPCLSSILSHVLPLTKRHLLEAGWCATGGTLNLPLCMPTILQVWCPQRCCVLAGFRHAQRIALSVRNALNPQHTERIMKKRYR